MYTPRMEAIAYQKTSNLHIKLSEVFQTVIDMKEEKRLELIKAGHSNVVKILYDEVYKYLKSSAVPKLFAVIQKETNLYLQSITLLTGDLSGKFSISTGFFGDVNIFKIEDRITGIGNKFKDKYTHLQHLAKLVEAFDRVEGSIKPDTDIIKKNMGFKLTLDVTAAFFATDYWPNHELIKPLTAQELSAIVMHEIGHCLSLIEHCGDAFHTMNHMRDCISTLQRQGTTKDDIKLITANLLPIIKKHQKDKNLPPKLAKKMNMLTTSMEQVNRIVGTAPEEETWEVSTNQTSVPVLGIVSRVFFAIFSDFVFNCLFGYILHECGKHAYDQQSAHGEKLGDTRTNHTNLFQGERWADEYVARHGMGQYLASGLRKLTGYYSVMDIEFYGKHQIGDGYRFSRLCVVLDSILKTCYSENYLDPTTYENNFRRVRRMLQDTKGFFKDESVPADIRNQWYKSIKELETEMKHVEQFKDTAFGEALFNTLTNMTNFARWFMLLKDGNLDRDTEILANRIDDMSNNKLFAQASRISTL